jgi:hypothetical protein
MDEKQGTGTGQAANVQSNAPNQAGGNRDMAQGNPQGSGGSPESLVDQARNTAADLAGRASDVAREAYDQGQQYVRQAGDRFRRPSAIINEPHSPSSAKSLRPRSSRCWRLEQSALVWPGSLAV